MSLEITSERDLIHVLGQALENMAKRPRYAATQMQVALHEYIHYCYRTGDFGSDMLITVRNLLRDIDMRVNNTAMDYRIGEMLKEQK